MSTIPSNNFYDVSYILNLPQDATLSNLIVNAQAIGLLGFGHFLIPQSLASSSFNINAECEIFTKFDDTLIKFVLIAPQANLEGNLQMGYIDVETETLTITYSGTSGSYVLKAGDTMTGNLTISSSSSQVILKDTSHNGETFVGWSSGHQNHGMYSDGYAPTATTWTNDGKWMIYRDSSGDIKVNGSADSATNATNSDKIKNKSDNYVTLAAALLDMVYPVGSIYMSVNSTSPATFLGGTWEQLEDRFLLGQGTTYSTVDSTGGEATHTLTTSELPAHTHGSKSLTGSLYAYSWSNGAASGIVSKTAETVNMGFYNGSSVGHIGYTITATHEHDSVGSGTAHNNMPPYRVVYMWKRTA